MYYPQVIYDDFVGNAEMAIAQIYKFLNKKIPSRVFTVIKTIRKDSTTKFL